MPGLLQEPERDGQEQAQPDQSEQEAACDVQVEVGCWISRQAKVLRWDIVVQAN